MTQSLAVSMYSRRLVEQNALAGTSGHGSSPAWQQHHGQSPRLGGRARSLVDVLDYLKSLKA